MKGIITSTLDWLKHPIYSDTNIGDWLGFLGLILVLSFMWSTVIGKLE